MPGALQKGLPTIKISHHGNFVGSVFIKVVDGRSNNYKKLWISYILVSNEISTQYTIRFNVFLIVPLIINAASIRMDKSDFN